MDELMPQDAMLDDTGGAAVAAPDLDLAPPETIEPDPAQSPWDVTGEPQAEGVGPPPAVAGDPADAPPAGVDDPPAPWEVKGEPEPDNSMAPPPSDGVEPGAGDPTQISCQDLATEYDTVVLPLSDGELSGESPLGESESSIDIGAAADLAAELVNGELSAEALAELTGLAVDPDGDGISSVPVDELAAFLERHDLAGTATTATVDDVAAAVTAGTPVDVLASDGNGVHALRIVGADQGVFTLQSSGGEERMTLSAPELGRGLDAAGNQVVRIPGGAGGLGEVEVPALDPAAITLPEAGPPSADAALAPIPAGDGDDSGLGGMAVATVVIPMVIGGGYLAARRVRT